MENSENKSNQEEYQMSPAQPQEIPESTLWPIVLASGVVFLFWGFITSIFISGIGLLLAGVAIAGWIGDLKP